MEQQGFPSFLVVLLFSKRAVLASLGFTWILCAPGLIEALKSHLLSTNNISNHFICQPSSVETLSDSPMASIRHVVPPFLVTLGAVCSQ